MTDDLLTRCGVKRFSEMTWPCPGEYSEKAEWILRYGIDFFNKEHSILNKEQTAAVLYGASVINAYAHLINSPQAFRNKVIAELRKK